MLHTITKKAAVAAIAVALLFFSSCKKDSSLITVKPAAAHQLLKVEQDADNSITFDYNPNGQLTQLVDKEGTTTFSSNLSYNDDKTIASASLNDKILKYIYTAGILTKVEYRSATPDNTLTYTADFINQNGKISEQDGTAYYFNNPNKDYKIKYAYNAAGDMISEDQSLWNSNTGNYFATQKTAYEYDTKNNPLSGLQVQSLLSLNVLSAHNVTKETIYDAQNQVIATHSYTYTYDNAGYPLTATEKTTSQSDPNVVTNQLRYTYKN